MSLMKLISFVLHGVGWYIPVPGCCGCGWGCVGSEVTSGAGVGRLYCNSK